MKHTSHLLSFAGTDALSAYEYANNYGGRLYGLLLQKLIISDKPWPIQEPIPKQESYILNPGKYVIIVPSVEGKVDCAVKPALLVIIHGVYDTLDLASTVLKKDLPYRAMLAKIFAVIMEDGGGEVKGVEKIRDEFKYII